MDDCEFFLEPPPELVNELLLFLEAPLSSNSRGGDHRKIVGDEVVGRCNGCGRISVTRLDAKKRWSRHILWDSKTKKRKSCGKYLKTTRDVCVFYGLEDYYDRLVERLEALKENSSNTLGTKFYYMPKPPF